MGPKPDPGVERDGAKPPAAPRAGDRAGDATVAVPRDGLRKPPPPAPAPGAPSLDATLAVPRDALQRLVALDAAAAALDATAITPRGPLKTAPVAPPPAALAGVETTAFLPAVKLTSPGGVAVTGEQTDLGKPPAAGLAADLLPDTRRLFKKPGGPDAPAATPPAPATKAAPAEPPAKRPADEPLPGELSERSRTTRMQREARKKAKPGIAGLGALSLPALTEDALRDPPAAPAAAAPGGAISGPIAGAGSGYLAPSSSASSAAASPPASGASARGETSRRLKKKPVAELPLRVGGDMIPGEETAKTDRLYRPAIAGGAPQRTKPGASPAPRPAPAETPREASTEPVDPVRALEVEVEVFREELTAMRRRLERLEKLLSEARKARGIVD